MACATFFGSKQALVPTPAFSFKVVSMQLYKDILEKPFLMQLVSSLVI